MPDTEMPAPTPLQSVRAEQKSAPPGAISYFQQSGEIKRERVIVPSRKPGGVHRG